jgi:hypothetical protein
MRTTNRRSMLARLLGRAALVLACAAPVAPVEVRLGAGPNAVHWSALRAAEAQQGREMIAAPITTRRFDRLARVHLAPTDDEMDALDRVHTAYLERYRAEIVPEVESLMRSMQGGMPSKSEFEKFLRDLERLDARVADADRAFLDAAASLVAEERRDGFTRLRDARERQRLRSGLAAFAPMIAGGGAAFVDLADLLAREEYALAVDEARRDAFDAILRGLESRALIQVRAYHSAAGDVFTAYFDVMAEMQAEQERAIAAAAAAAAEGGELDMADQMQASFERMRAIGAPIQKAVRANHAANRAGVQQLRGILPDEVLLAVREAVVLRTFGMMRFALGEFRDGGAIDRLLRRIGRDRELPEEIRESARAIGIACREETLDLLEQLADAVVEEGGSMSAMMGARPDGDSAFERIPGRIAALQERTLRRLQELLGERAGLYITRYRIGEEEGEEAERLAVNEAPSQEEGGEGSEDASVLSGGRGEFAWTVPMPIAAVDVVRLARLAGIADDRMAIVESIARDAERSARERTSPLRARHADSQQRLYARAADGEMRFDAAAQSDALAALREAVGVVLEGDRELRDGLAAGLGLEVSHPFLRLLELEQLPMAASQSVGVDGGRVVSPAGALVAARATPAEVAAFLAAGGEAWRAILDRVPALALARIEANAESFAAQSQFSRDSGDQRKAMEEMSRAQRRLEDADRALAKEVRDAFERSVAGGVSDEEATARLRRAFRERAHPAIFTRAEDLSRQLADACALRELSDQQIARLEVLRSQYADRFDALSAEMVAIADAPATGAADEKSWRTFAERQAKLEDLRFRRREVTEKARASAVRILGAARAEDVHGLVLDEAARRDSAASRGFDPFAGLDDD